MQTLIQRNHAGFTRRRQVQTASRLFRVRLGCCLQSRIGLDNELELIQIRAYDGLEGDGRELNISIDMPPFTGQAFLAKLATFGVKLLGPLRDVGELATVRTLEPNQEFLIVREHHFWLEKFDRRPVIVSHRDWITIFTKHVVFSVSVYFGPITTRTAISTKTANPMIPRASKKLSQAHSIAKATMSAAMGKALRRRSMALPSVAWVRSRSRR